MGFSLPTDTSTPAFLMKMADLAMSLSLVLKHRIAKG
jgi:hypothetical protein